MSLDYLYYFHNESTVIMEVKVTGLPDDAPLDQVFHWLRYDRKTQRIEKFGFQTMKVDGEQHYRRFDQGELRFDASLARLVEADSGPELTLTVAPVGDVPADVKGAVETFLTAP